MTARKDDILCLSSIDWDFVWQGHQEIMARYAAQGHRVLFIENTGARAPRLRDWPRVRHRWRNWRRGTYGVREERRNLFVFSPVAIPLPHSRLASWINRRLLLWIVHRWMQAVGFSRPIVWTFLPTRLTLDLLGRIDYSLLIYYCIDRFTASSSGARKIARAETELLQRSDLVFVTSQALREHCARHHARVHVFPFGVDLTTFERRSHGAPPAELAPLPRPIVGYVGGLHQWVDQELLRAVALRHPAYSFVLVGPPQTDVARLTGLPNVYVLGQRSHEELPGYIRVFDVGIIPYRLTEYTRHVFPTKLAEYLALGKPVVATALPEVERFNREFGPLVRLGNTAETFGQALTEALAQRNGGEALERQRAAAANSWEARLEQMQPLIAQALERKRSGHEQDWQQTIRAVARTARRRVLQWLWPTLAVWLLLFHTPLLWWVAQPLRLSDSPQPAAAIVVFAGGVGESGQAGQGYEERVQHAVELYRQRLASVLLFSSGYVYTMREPDVMKALAVSLGVPAQAILLEEQAGNTYQNVVFSARVLRERQLHSALLISSPYHMRRVALVWRKQAPDVQVRLTPVPLSQFYGRRRAVAWRHWRAIAHEYAAIAYYWLRGWI